MAGNFRDRKLVVAVSGVFKKQLAFGNSMPASDIDTRHPQTSPAYPGRTTTRESIRDCTGEYIIREDITSRLSRLTVSFDANAFLLAGWLAEAMGVATAPTGSQTAEVFTITPGGTISGGTFFLQFSIEGITDQSIDIAWNATALQIKAALEDMRSVKKGQFSVTGTLATTVVIAGTGKYAAGNLPLMVVDGTNLTGSTPTVGIATTTAGTNKLVTLSRTSASQTPVISMIVGFDGDSTDARKFQDLAVNTVTINGAVRGKVTVTVELIGSAKTVAAVGYVMPTCVNVDPIYVKDCKVIIDGEYVAEELRDFSYTFSNNIFTGDDPFPFDDIDVVRLEHGDRTSSFSFTFYGSPGDTVYDLADNESQVAVSLIIGAPVNRVTVIAPKTCLKLSDTPITFAGEANRSAYAITGTPYFDNLVGGTPDYAEYRGPESTTMLAAST